MLLFTSQHFQQLFLNFMVVMVVRMMRTQMNHCTAMVLENFLTNQTDHNASVFCNGHRHHHMYWLVLLARARQRPMSYSKESARAYGAIAN